ncbi:uncharacterized protein LOC126896487 [Daktulosphaira vitifoliae]|uniref:uncharacterized protein LOC126896487 n=1 Tax=Daktulosphaira vitifoliae TaxID=58002 RepID=UPI0021A9FD23|nr:uncharacterized protein LOC126896487 [Daktulosphaira vitifoliae]
MLTIKSAKHLLYVNIYFPESLMDIAGNSLNKLKEPLSWSWSVSDVVNWVENKLKLPQYVLITMHIRILYGIPPDKCVGRCRQSIHDIYGQYYTHLAQLAQKSNSHKFSNACISLYDFSELIGLINKPQKMIAECHFDQNLIKKQKTLLARLPATEYLRGQPCIHESRAIMQVQLPSCKTDYSEFNVKYSNIVEHGN